jgi:DNA-binding XRE family transcriptional regulator
MDAANTTIASVAEAVGVTPSTVSRWISGATLPHAATRLVVAELFGVEVTDLWPELPSDPAPVVASYVARSDVPPEVWRQLIHTVQARVDLLGFAVRFLPAVDARVWDHLRAAEARGARIRICLADPDAQVVTDRDKEETSSLSLIERVREGLRLFSDQLGDLPGVEIRLHTVPLYASVYRFDNDMLVVHQLYGVHGEEAPTSHYRAHPNSDQVNLFDQFLRHFDAIWATARPSVRP